MRVSIDTLHEAASVSYAAYRFAYDVEQRHCRESCACNTCKASRLLREAWNLLAEADQTEKRYERLKQLDTAQ